MERLAAFRPHLTGAVWRGTATRLNSIFIDLFCDDSKSAEIALIDQRVDYDVSSVDGPRGRVLDVLNLHVPSPAIAGRRPRRPHRARLRRPARRAPARRARPQRARRPGGAARARGRRREPAPRRPRRGRRSPRSAIGAGTALAPRSRRCGGRRRRRARRSTSGRSASRASTARRSRWPAGAAGRCCSISGRRGAGPASSRCRCSTASRASTRRSGWRVLALAVDQPDPGAPLRRRARRCAAGGPRRRRSASISRASSATSHGGLPFTRGLRFDAAQPSQRRPGRGQRAICWRAGQASITLGTSPDLRVNWRQTAGMPPRICSFRARPRSPARSRYRTIRWTCAS